MSCLEGKVVAIQEDVAKYREVHMMGEKIIKRYKTIDILINNAGITHLTPITETEEEEWDEVMAVNQKCV
jgi:3-oxoacyl-[acyl-carrier protein] reductase